MGCCARKENKTVVGQVMELDQGLWAGWECDTNIDVLTFRGLHSGRVGERSCLGKYIPEYLVVRGDLDERDEGVLCFVLATFQ